METSSAAATLGERFERAVAALAATGVIESALLASRDGFPIAGRCTGVTNVEMFAAMHATALGAAEIALHGVGANRGVSLVALMNGHQFVSRAVTDSLFVVAIVRPGRDCHAVMAWMDDLGGQLAAA